MAEENTIKVLPKGFVPKKRVAFNAFSKESYAMKEAFKTLRTNIMFSGDNVHTMVVTSVNANDGKSSISTELAKSFSDDGKKTLLIDADMRKSVMLSGSARHGKVLGLSELLSGLAELEDVIYGTQDDNYNVIFTGRFPPNPVELLNGKKLIKVLEVLKDFYDYIIIDTPPLGLVIDAAIVSTICDGAILVVAQNKTNIKDALAVKAQLDRSGTKVLGVAINETEKQVKYAKYYYSGKYNYLYY